MFIVRALPDAFVPLASGAGVGQRVAGYVDQAMPLLRMCP
jgi:hypothetical protein